MAPFPHAFNAHVQPPVWDWIAYRNDRLASGPRAADADKLACRIRIQSSFTTDFIQQVLESKLLFYRDLFGAVSAGGFGQFRQELLNPDSDHYALKPTHTVLLLDPRVDSGEESLRELEEIVRVHTGVLPDGILIVSNFFRTSDAAPDVRTWNDRLYGMAGKTSQVRILDLDRWAARWGWQKVIDPKQDFLAGLVIAPDMTPHLAEEILAFVYERLGLRKKCLVLDLDETLWGGIAGEDGPGGILLDVQPPGNVYRAIQETALAIQKKGVLLAVASKNNPRDAFEIIDSHPHMLLRRDAFADIQIGWQPKDQMLLAAARALNIGVDSLVFVDDNPTERELVRNLLPAVTVLDLPADPAWWPRYLEGLKCFEASTVTAEDRGRARMYAAEKQRKEELKSAGTLEDYLRTLDTVVTIGALKPDGDVNLPRIAQLSQRTNQFNLTTTRYSEGALTDLVRGGGRVCWMKVTDRLGDSGLVGVAVLTREGAGWSIQNFFMSCRVIGRNIEIAFLRELIGDLKTNSEGAAVTARFVPSEKNMQTRGFYNEKMGFDVVRTEPTGTSYRLALGGFVNDRVAYITIRREN